MRLRVPSLASLSGLRIQSCCELLCRSQTRLDPALLWLWRRPAAVALIRPLAWKPPYDVGVALKRTKDQKKKTNWILSTLKAFMLQRTIKTMQRQPIEQEKIFANYLPDKGLVYRMHILKNYSSTINRQKDKCSKGTFHQYEWPIYI